MKGYVYAIKSHQTDEIYIGSTIKNIEVRLREHYYKFMNFLDDKHSYNTSYEMFQYTDVFIEVIEEIEFENVRELRLKEGEHIRKNKCVNISIVGRSKEEYRDATREIMKKYSKEYHEENKEKINERKKEYAKKNKEQIKERKKNYYKANKEHITQRIKEYREKNNK